MENVRKYFYSTTFKFINKFQNFTSLIPNLSKNNIFIPTQATMHVNLTNLDIMNTTTTSFRRRRE